VTGRVTAEYVGGLLERLRAQAPLVQCLTNSVVTNFTANALLAIGASPAMVDIPTEAEAFAEAASASLINIGTPHREQRDAMRGTARAALAAGTPWVLDPVAVGLLPVRTRLAADLLEHAPTGIRGNPSEVIALAGLGGGGRGVDSVDSADSAADAAALLARRHGSVVAVSGPTDVITDGIDTVRVSNGHRYLTQVTGGGCALGAVTAAFLTLDEDRLGTAVAATAVYTVAAELAAGGADGPGSFAMAFLDALATVDAETVRSRVRLT
jgi:hydroxyethylthiazole kinase